MNLHRFNIALDTIGHPADQREARLILELTRWDGGVPVCPECGDSERVLGIAPNKAHRVREGLYLCRVCTPHRQFTVTSSTELAGVRDLRKVVLALIELKIEREKSSMRKVAEVIGMTPEYANKLCHKLRKEFNNSFGYVKDPKKQWDYRKGMSKKLRRARLVEAQKRSWARKSP